MKSHNFIACFLLAIIAGLFAQPGHAQNWGFVIGAAVMTLVFLFDTLITAIYSVKTDVNVTVNGQKITPAISNDPE